MTDIEPVAEVVDEEFAPPPPSARKARAAVRSEAAVLADVMDYFKALPGAHARKVHGSAVAGAGQPDLDACVQGRAYKIEIKRPGKRPTPLQFARMRTWADAGAVVGWCTETAHAEALVARAADHDWTNPLTGPGDPTLEE